MIKHMIKYDQKQKQVIKTAKNKYSKNVFDAVNYLNRKSARQLTIGECLLILNETLNFKLR